ncbi:MAG: hypothetical protein K9N23_12910 [Akkermansiaceae bacterium]|nr:hypothetical protein [Akkermansiaceae bacterium]MCF7732585.1 hypothetical protein [Akkermansiaceae bacterium]
MTTRTLLLGISVLSIAPTLTSQSLDDAEVRLPYAELKALLSQVEPAAKPPALAPALLSARLRLSIENDRPVIDATFRATSFSDNPTLIPLLGGDVSLEKQDPQDASILVHEDALNLAADRAGIQTLQLRLLPIVSDGAFRISLPPCPAAILETGELPADQSLVLQTTDGDVTLTSGTIRPLPHRAQSLAFRLLDPDQTREALRPPDPSSWTWQHQALVRPREGGLHYQILAHATAESGSGVAATLPLPADARDIAVTGDDLVSQVKTRGENRTLGLSLAWKTRGILDRQLLISYHLPLRPLDRTWHLQAPGGEGTLTRFIVATSPLLAYSAPGLSAPLAPEGLPAALAAVAKGSLCQYLEGPATADLQVTPMPVAATAEGVATEALWSLKIEPDGAMLASGAMTIQHKGLLDFVFDTPEGMKLLSCEVNGRPASPIDLGEGKLKLTLPPDGEKSKIECSFTGSITPLDPVEGTMKLSLPKVELFIHSLQWMLDLPAGYQAETQGNLTRSATPTGKPSSQIHLQKNLCRDERPEVHVFYQRTDLKR